MRGLVKLNKRESKGETRRCPHETEEEKREERNTSEEENELRHDKKMKGEERGGMGDVREGGLSVETDRQL